MDKARLKKEFSQLLDEIEQSEKEIDNFYDFEVDFEKRVGILKRRILEEKLGTKSKDHRKKKE